MLPDRLKATVVAWLKTIPASIRARITTVCTDMWEGYITAVQEVLPTAALVIDRFHVAQHYRGPVAPKPLPGSLDKVQRRPG